MRFSRGLCCLLLIGLFFLNACTHVGGDGVTPKTDCLLAPPPGMTTEICERRQKAQIYARFVCPGVMIPRMQDPDAALPDVKVLCTGLVRSNQIGENTLGLCLREADGLINDALQSIDQGLNCQQRHLLERNEDDKKFSTPPRSMLNRKSVDPFGPPVKVRRR